MAVPRILACDTDIDLFGGTERVSRHGGDGYRGAAKTWRRGDGRGVGRMHWREWHLHCVWSRAAAMMGRERRIGRHRVVSK